MHIYSQLIRAQLENLDSDPSNPSEGHVYWNRQIGKFKVYSLASSKWSIIDAPIAYIENDGAEASTNGWATYADAAAVNPIDGIGGSPTVALTRETSLPLRGGASFLLSKDASDRQGEGASYDFVIDLADQGQSLTLEFDYSVSGAFTTGGSSDVKMYVYDVVNASLLTLSNDTIDAVSGRFMATFPAASNSTSYRLIYHVSTTNASVWALKFDRVSVSPNVPVAQSVSPVPVGTVLDYAGFSSPSGYLLCDGLAVSRATYSPLFSVIGEMYGIGDGSTTFNIPDFRGRVAVGKDNMGSTVPPNVVYHSNYNDFDTTPEIGTTVTTLSGGASVATGLLAIPGGAFNGAYVNLDSEFPGRLTNATFRWEVLSGYSGSPTSKVPVFITRDRVDTVVSIGDNFTPSDNTLLLTHETSGQLSIYFEMGGIVLISTTNIGIFSPDSVTKDEFEIDVDGTNGDIYVYLNGTQIYSNTSLTYDFTAFNTSWLWSFANSGYFGVPGVKVDFDSLTIFDTVQHTGASYIPGAVEFTNTPAGRVTVPESGIDGTSLGATGGSETHQLTTPELAAHLHTGTTDPDGVHSHGINGNLSSTLLTLNTAAGGTGPFYLNDVSQNVSIQASSTHTHTFTSTNSGSDATHQNMPPSLIVNKIIKT